MKAEDISLRPQYLSQYKGQAVAVSSLQIMIAAAKKRGECLDHVLITGPGGLGKTTLANCIAHEMNVPVKFVTAPNLTSESDFQQILASMNGHEILFIDEIHALNPTMVEMLYTVMEDFYFDAVVKFRNLTQTARVNLKPFTVIGATTNPEKLTGSLRTRFGMSITLDYMTPMALTDLITDSAERLGLSITKPAAEDLARCSRGTPRVANNLLKRVRDLAEVKYGSVVDSNCVREALYTMRIDPKGLDAADRKYLQTILNFGNAPMGIAMLSQALREARQVIEEIREPFLIEQGLVMRTPKGRIVTEAGQKHLQEVA